MISLNNKDLETLEKIIIKFIKYLNIQKIYDYTNINYVDSNIISLLVKNKQLNNEIKESIIIYNNNINIDPNIIKNNTIININDNTGFYLNHDSYTKISIHGKYFDYEKANIDNFKVLAIMHVYNEEDIIGQTIKYLLDEGIDVYVIDNWSKDNTSNIIAKYKEAYPNRVYTEKFPINYDNECYEWSNQLKRTEEISKQLDYDWFIHYDADECRISPFKGLTLKETIYMADKLGFNTIENTVIVFKLTNENQENIFMKDTYFEFGKKPGHFVQYKTWKKSNDIELVHSGGHVAKIANQKVFPLKILNKHYPFRALKQASKKVFIDRKQRFTKEELSIGWHTQYENITNNNDLINKNISQLILWDNNTINKYYVKLFIDARI